MQDPGFAHAEAGMDVVKPAGCDVIHGPAHVLDASTGDDVGLRSKSAPEVSEQFVELVETRRQAHPHHGVSGHSACGQGVEENGLGGWR